MVAFCHSCKHSLPYADVIIRNGQEEPTPGYVCPLCGELANEEEDADDSQNDNTPELDDDEFVIRDGQVETTQ